MSAVLSRLKELMSVAKDGSEEQRSALFSEISKIYLASPERFSESEHAHFDGIMSKLAKTAPVALRQEIAAKIAGLKSAPKGLVRQFARDEPAVAEPILKNSNALTDEDLAALARDGSEDGRKAIASRRKLSAMVIEGLVAHGEAESLATLASNNGAAFTDETMEKIVDKARTHKELLKPISQRLDLPPYLLTKLYFIAPPPLKQDILKRADFLDPTLIKESVSANRKKMEEMPVEDKNPKRAADKKLLAEKIKSRGVNEAFLARLVEKHRAHAFHLAFSYFTGLDVTTAQAIIKNKSRESLALALRARNVKPETFEAILRGLKREEESETLLRRMIALYPKVPVEAAERIMRFWHMRAQSSAASRPASSRPRIHDIGFRAAG